MRQGLRSIWALVAREPTPRELWPTDLSDDELQVLARYNGERSRGLLHTSEWQQVMVKLQARFDGETP